MSTALEVFLAAKVIFDAELAANRDDGVVIYPPGIGPPTGGIAKLRPTDEEQDRPVDVMIRVAERCRRLQDDGHLPVLRKHWPTGVPTPKAAEANGYLFTSVERLDIQAAVTAAEREAYAADPQIVGETVTRLKNLAPDLFAGVHVKARRAGVPNITSALATTDDMTAVAALLVEAEAAAEERWQTVAGLVDTGLVDMSLVELSWITARTEPQATWGSLTALETERAVHVLQAIADSYLCTTDDGLVVSIEQEFVVVDRWGGKKALLEAAKAVAVRHGLPKPRSTAVALADPLLVALIVNGPKG